MGMRKLCVYIHIIILYFHFHNIINSLFFLKTELYEHFTEMDRFFKILLR